MSGETFEVTLDTMAHGGSALGRAGGRTIFVPYTIPGERVSAHIVNDRGRVAFAEGVTLLDASADRVLPHCPHFGPGRCGRCTWQHIDYPAQLLLKQDVLGDQMERVGGFRDPEIRPLIPSPAQWSYNYHMTLLRAGDGRFGFPAASHHGAFPIEECHILHPELLALFHEINLDGIGGIEKLKLQIGSDGAKMLILTMHNDEAPELEVEIPASINMLLDDAEPVNLIGETHTRYTVGGRQFRVTAGGYFRPNIAQLDNLVAEVTHALALTGRENVLDLYAGVGLFSAFIAPHARLVTMIESFPPGATDAEVNLADFDNVDIIEGGVEDVLPELDERYQAAVIDPSPSGLSGDALDSLVEIAPARLVYVSSDPAILARDGKRLAAKGYKLAYVQPIDLSPQTHYIDSVALFTR